MDGKNDKSPLAPAAGAPPDAIDVQIPDAIDEAAEDIQMKDGPKMRKSNYTTTMIEIIEKHVEQGDGAATIIKKNPLFFDASSKNGIKSVIKRIKKMAKVLKKM